MKPLNHSTTQPHQTFADSICSEKQLDSGDAAHHGQNVALLETPNGITLLGASKTREANGNGRGNGNGNGRGNGHGQNHERFSVERRVHDEDDSFEYGTDRESSVYNPTTKPLRNAPMGQAAGAAGAAGAATPDSDTDTDLLQRGNQLGIPESRFSRWLPKDQRELLEKQAKLLSGRSQAVAKAAPPATPPKPNKHPQATTTATTTTTPAPAAQTTTTTTTMTTPMMTTPRLPQETEI